MSNTHVSTFTDQDNKNRVPRSVVRSAIFGTVVIGIGAALLSFTALADLAVRAGTPRGLSYVWPVIVDGVIVVATVAIVALRHADSRARSYAWTLLAGGALISVIANGAHAVVAATASTPEWIAVTVASVPPIVLLAITHLTVVLARRTPVDQLPPATTPTPAPVPDPEGRNSERDPFADLFEDVTTSGDQIDQLPTPVIAGIELSATHVDTPSTPTIEDPPAGFAVEADAQVVDDEVRAGHQPDTAITSPQDHDEDLVDATVVMAPRLRAVPARNNASLSQDERELLDWVIAQVAAGEPISGGAAVKAGVAPSESTARRRMTALKKTHAWAFEPATAQREAM